LEKQIQSLIEKDDKLQEQYEHISEIKGVGLLTFAVLVAETGGRKSKAIGQLCG